MPIYWHLSGSDGRPTGNWNDPALLRPPLVRETVSAGSDFGYTVRGGGWASCSFHPTGQSEDN